MKELLDKYFPILLTFTKPSDRISLTEKELKDFAIAIHNNAIDSCIENADLCLRKYNLQGEFTEENFGKEISSEREYEYFGINRQSLEKLKI